METVDAVVVGAGVVGLAAARALAMQGREVIILEAENAIGTQTSARNSEVIHAGIYYPKDSLKARFCVRGRELLYHLSNETGFAAQRCGKLIVATNDAQAQALRSIEAHARGNGVSDIRWLNQAECRELEPDLFCVSALHSPSTGIVDSHGFMLALQGQAEHHGAMLGLLSRLKRISWRADGIELEVQDCSGSSADASPGDSPGPTDTILASLVVNATGHHAVQLASSVAGAALTNYQPVFTKGNYFRLQGAAPFSRLIYPVPEPGGLGVHLTLDLGGQARFGPDVQEVDRFDYEVQPARSTRFYDAIRQYWPGLPDGALLPDYSGFRPKLKRDGSPFADFAIETIGQADEARIIHLLGIESPGLTSALAIGEAVAELASK
ncbi:MAG: NAD(P)/FAD-dependent oxidoreductase [Burkholderiaceae bacterium]